MRERRQARVALDRELRLRLVCPERLITRREIFTAVPYAQISVHVSPISDVSKRIATTAFAPFASASSVIRWITSARLSDSAFVIPFSSPPKIDFNPAPICEPMFRERTVRPNTSP